MNGNEVAITFFNYGLLAGVGEIRGNWPKGSNDFYVGDVLPIIAAEVPITNRPGGARDTLVRHVVSTRGPSNRGINTDPTNPSVAWTFEAKPGFASNAEPPRYGQAQRPRGHEHRPDLVAGPLARPADLDQPHDRQGPVERLLRPRPVQRRPRVLLLGRRQQRPRTAAPVPLVPRRRQRAPSAAASASTSRSAASSGASFSPRTPSSGSTRSPTRLRRPIRAWPSGLTVGTLSGGDGDTQGRPRLLRPGQPHRLLVRQRRPRQPGPARRLRRLRLPRVARQRRPTASTTTATATRRRPAGLDVFGFPVRHGRRRDREHLLRQTTSCRARSRPGDPLVLIDAATGERTFEYVPASGPITVVSQGRSYTVQRRRHHPGGDHAGADAHRRRLPDADGQRPHRPGPRRHRGRGRDAPLHTPRPVVRPATDRSSRCRR